MFSLYRLHGFRKIRACYERNAKKCVFPLKSHTNFKRDAQNVDITDRAQILHTYLGPEMGSEKL